MNEIWGMKSLPRADAESHEIALRSATLRLLSKIGRMPRSAVTPNQDVRECGVVSRQPAVLRNTTPHSAKIFIPHRGAQLPWQLLGVSR
jgi:hypothetical protein